KSRKSGLFSPNRHSGWVPVPWARPVRGEGSAAFRRRAGHRLLHWRVWRLVPAGRRFLPAMTFFVVCPWTLDPVPAELTSLLQSWVFANEHLQDRLFDVGDDRAVPGCGRADRRRPRHGDRFSVRSRDEFVRLLELGQGAFVHVWRAAGGRGKR